MHISNQRVNTFTPANTKTIQSATVLLLTSTTAVEYLGFKYLFVFHPPNRNTDVLT